MRKIINRKDLPVKPMPEPSTSDLIDGSLVVIDKPKGPFSFHITDKVKKVLGVKKTGHAGTLDPNATGVLPIGINKGCHLLRAISKAPKAYKGVMHLHLKASLSKVVETSKDFVGQITQLPPVRSAVKREEREREIYELIIDKMDGRDVYFSVKCEAGTYIRKLVVDWGESIGVTAHLKNLQRTLAGPYNIKDTVNFDEFLNEPKNYLKPLESGVAHLGHLWLDDNTIESISHGSQPFLPGVIQYQSGIKKGDLVALMDSSSQLAAIAKSLMDSSSMKKAKGQVAKLLRVFL